MSTLSEDLDQLDSGMASRDERLPEDIISLISDDDDSMNDLKTNRLNQRREDKDSFAEDFEQEEDESLAERLLGLTEMFPAEVRKCVYNVGTGLYACTKGLYAFSCSATWLFFSSSAILFAPVLFELERAQMEEAQRAQQKQVLLGPKTAMSTMNAPGIPRGSPVAR